jgi:hypothetical protein
VADELTKALLLEEAVSKSAVADALFASVTGKIPLTQALLDAGATSPEVLTRYLARTEAPFVRQVAPVRELVDRLPPGLCERLLAIPIRRDAITSTVDVAVADANETHAGRELGYHLRAPIRVIRAPLAAIREALRRLRIEEASSGSATTAGTGAPAGSGGPSSRRLSRPPAPSVFTVAGRLDSLTPPIPSHPPVSLAASVAPPPRAAYATGAAPAVVVGPRPGRKDTPPWGVPRPGAPSQRPTKEASDPPPKGRLGSEIPIPLTRKTFSAPRGGTQRPPAAADPSRGPAFIPAPPPVPHSGAFAAFAPRLDSAPISVPPPTTSTPDDALRADTAAVLAALRSAASRDEILELVLTGARVVARKVALFVVKRGGYLGWACTPELGDRTALQSVLVPLDSESVFDLAVREGLYLGGIQNDEVHAGLLRAMNGASRDVAVVPIRVEGKTAVVILADDLGDTMIGTRRLDEIARAAGDAFARIVRTRQR